MIYGFGDRYTNRCTTPLAPILYHTRESNYIFPTKSAILEVFMKPIKTKSAPRLSLIRRVLTSLSFWITLWSLMGAYFFIIGLLHLLFGTKLIPEPLLFSTTIVKVSTILTCFVYTCFFSRIPVLPSFLFAPANFICWLFYFPSQILLANSSILTIPDYGPFDSKLKYLGAKSKFIGQL